MVCLPILKKNKSFGGGKRVKSLVLCKKDETLGVFKRFSNRFLKGFNVFLWVSLPFRVDCLLHL